MFVQTPTCIRGIVNLSMDAPSSFMQLWANINCSQTDEMVAIFTSIKKSSHTISTRTSISLIWFTVVEFSKFWGRVTGSSGGLNVSSSSILFVCLFNRPQWGNPRGSGPHSRGHRLVIVRLLLQGCPPTSANFIRKQRKFQYANTIFINPLCPFHPPFRHPQLCDLHLSVLSQHESVRPNS